MLRNVLCNEQENISNACIIVLLKITCDELHCGIVNTD